MNAAHLGSRLFENRRWVHPPFATAALVLGGASPERRLAGAALLALMLVVRLWVTRYMGGAARVHARKALEPRVLLTGGPFAWVRNPLYLANSCGLAGACLLLGPPWLAVLALITSLLWYRAVIAWEESVLSRLYGAEYRDYVARVPRLLPRPPAGTSAQPGHELYPWHKVFRRERGALLGAAGWFALTSVIAPLGPWPWNHF